MSRNSFNEGILSPDNNAETNRDSESMFTPDPKPSFTSKFSFGRLSFSLKKQKSIDKSPQSKEEKVKSPVIKFEKNDDKEESLKQNDIEKIDEVQKHEESSKSEDSQLKDDNSNQNESIKLDESLNLEESLQKDEDSKPELSSKSEEVLK